MQTWAYAAAFDRQADGEIIVRFPDIPGALTGADNETGALALAEDALEEAILAMIEHGDALPALREARLGEILVALPPATAARAALARAMAAQRLSKVGLANLLGKDEKAVRRMLGRKGSSVDQVFEALRVVGAKVALANA